MSSPVEATDHQDTFQTFQPFYRLPTEIQDMIWRASLEARVVRLVEITSQDQGFAGNGCINEEDCESWESVKRLLTREKTEARYIALWTDDNDQPLPEPRTMYERTIRYGVNQLDHDRFGDLLCTRWRTPTNTPLPTAFYVCRSSRQALLPLYPLCFASITHPPSTRFNLSLDILCLPHMRAPQATRLFTSLRQVEVPQLKFLAIDEAWLKFAVEEYPEELKDLLSSLIGIQRLFVFRNVYQALASPHAEVINICDRLDLFEDFPTDLPNFDTHDRSSRLYPGTDALPKIAKMVWGWPQRTEYGYRSPGTYHPSR